jgi:hypothetical protein
LFDPAVEQAPQQLADTDTGGSGYLVQLGYVRRRQHQVQLLLLRLINRTRNRMTFHRPLVRHL